MITCRDIMNLKLDGVELLAGEAGMDRMVSWTYLCQTKPYADQMNQGNFALVVVDYVRFDLEEAYQAMLELYELRISAYALSIVDDRESLFPRNFWTRQMNLSFPSFMSAGRGLPLLILTKVSAVCCWKVRIRGRLQGITCITFCLAIISMPNILKKFPVSSVWIFPIHTESVLLWLTESTA